MSQGSDKPGSSYWAGLATNRMRRRGVLGLGMSAASAAALAMWGCGSSGGNKSTKGTPAGPSLFTNTAEEGPPKRGGTWAKTTTQEPPNLDPFLQAANETYYEAYPALSHLVRYGTGPKYDPKNLTPVPDITTGWEMADGGTTFTFKLRPDVKFHNIPPVSGRLLDADDISYSFKRLQASTIWSQTLGTLNPTFQTPDKQTVVMKLAKPNVGFWNLLVEPRTFFIMPREADGGYDARNTLIGSGPWMLANHVVSSRFEYKRNPDYFEKGIPYMDGMNCFILNESAQLRAQFRSGALPTLGASSQSVLNASDAQELLQFNQSFRATEVFAFVGFSYVSFQRGEPANPPLKDVRLRQAISMLIDRSTIYETMGQLDVWKKMGIDRPLILDNFVPKTYQWWVDPRSKEMGDSAKWWSFDVAEAKKLLAAAGYPTGWTSDYHTTPTFMPPPYLETSEVTASMLETAGFKLNRVSDDYNSVYQPKTQIGLNTGMQFGGGFTFNDATVGLDNFFAAKGQRNHMGVDDPIFNDLQAKQQVTFDEKERRNLFIQLQKHLSDEMRLVIVSNKVLPLAVSWPWVRNNFAYRGFNEYDTQAYYWLDK